MTPSGRSLVLAALMMMHGMSAAHAQAGRYRLSGGPDVASELVLDPDGSFAYFLAAGSLDEHARGRWSVDGAALRLTTIPRPVAPVFSAGRVARSGDASLILHVTAPNGAGIAAVDLRVGFDAGGYVDGYTQDHGWSLAEGERRTPRWVEFGVPIHGLRSQRFPIDLARGNAFTFVLTPNDIGEVDFTGMRIDVVPGRIVVHRGDTPLTFEAVPP